MTVKEDGHFVDPFEGRIFVRFLVHGTLLMVQRNLSAIASLDKDLFSTPEIPALRHALQSPVQVR